MADEIKIRAWKKEKNTPVADKEIVTVRAEKAIYVGTPDKPIKVGDANWETRIADLETKVKKVATTTYVDNKFAELRNEMGGNLNNVYAAIDELRKEILGG